MGGFKHLAIASDLERTRNPLRTLIAPHLPSDLPARFRLATSGARKRRTNEAIMANKTLFNTTRGAMVPAANTRNEAGGLAYAMPPKHALAQYAATGCLNATFYASADEQLATVLDLCKQVEPEFIARTALYARSEG